MKIARNAALPILILSLCLLFGGTLQFVGVLSLTQSNYLVLSLICLYLLCHLSLPRLTSSDMVLIILAAYVVAGIVLNGSDITGVSVYLYYLACPLLAVRFVRQIAKSDAWLLEDKLYRWLTVFLVLQLVATIIQNVLAIPLSEMSAVEVIPLDVVSGTFYMKSDGSLSAFCAIASMVAIWSGQPRRRKALVVFLCMAIVLLANAKAFQGLFPAIVVWAIVCESSLKGKYAKVGLLLLSMLGIILLLAAWSSLTELWQIFSSYLFDVYDFRYGDNKAQRLAPLGEMLNNPLSYFGQGALTYYNPITKQWLYNSGFSLIYNFYIDYGLVGLSLVLIYFLALTIEIAGANVRSFTLYAVLLVFCMFSPAITDIAFVISYCFACTLLARRSIRGSLAKGRSDDGVTSRLAASRHLQRRSDFSLKERT